MLPGGRLGGTQRYERIVEHGVGRDTGLDEGAEDMDTEPDLLENGRTIGGVDVAVSRGRGQEGFRSNQAREPGLIQVE